MPTALKDWTTTGVMYSAANTADLHHLARGRLRVPRQSLQQPGHLERRRRLAGYHGSPSVVGDVVVSQRSSHGAVGPDGGSSSLAEPESAPTKQNCLPWVSKGIVNLLANTSELLWCIEFDEPVALDLPEIEQVERIFGARVVEANEAFARAYNSTLAEVIDRWRVEDFIPRSFPTSVPFLLQAVRSRYRMEEVETTERTTDGETKIFVNNFIGTIHDGKVFRVWGMCRDVTETRAIEEQIRLRQEAIESSNDGFVIADATLPDLPIIYVNQRFEELTGYTSDEILGRNCRFLQGADTDAETVTRFREALAAGTRFQGEVLNYCKDGSPFWNFLRISPVRNKNGEITHFIGLQTDITERKLADEASRQKDFRNYYRNRSLRGNY